MTILSIFIFAPDLSSSLIFASRSGFIIIFNVYVVLRTAPNTCVNAIHVDTVNYEEDK